MSKINALVKTLEDWKVRKKDIETALKVIPSNDLKKRVINEKIEQIENLQVANNLIRIENNPSRQKKRIYKYRVIISKEKYTKLSMDEKMSFILSRETRLSLRYLRRQYKLIGKAENEKYDHRIEWVGSKLEKEFIHSNEYFVENEKKLYSLYDFLVSKNLLFDNGTFDEWKSNFIIGSNNFPKTEVKPFIWQYRTVTPLLYLFRELYAPSDINKKALIRTGDIWKKLCIIFKYHNGKKKDIVNINKKSKDARDASPTGKIRDQIDTFLKELYK